MGTEQVNNTAAVTAPKPQTGIVNSQIKSRSNSLAESEARLEKLRSEAGTIRADENQANNSGIANQNSQKEGNAYTREVNNSNQERVIQAQIDSDKKGIADLQTQAGKATNVSEVSPSGPQDSSKASNNTWINPEERKSTPETQAQTANALNTLAPGGKDPNQADMIQGLKAAGGNMAEVKSGDNSMVSQFKGEANINEDAVSNRNCGRCALLSTARAMGVGGDASTANSDLEKTGALMGQNGKNEYQGTQINDFLTGAKNMGMNAKAGKGGVEQVKQQLEKGNQVVVATDPSKYTGFTKKGGHMVRVSGYNAEKDTFTLHDSLFQKPIEVQSKQLGKAMSSDLLGENKNTMIAVDKNSKLDKGVLDKVPEQQKSSEPALGSPSASLGKKADDKGPVQGSAGNEPSKIDNTSRNNSEQDTTAGNGSKKEKPDSPGRIYPGSGYENDWTYDSKTSEVIPIDKSDKSKLKSISSSSQAD